MNNTYTPPQEKVVTSLALEKDVREWLDKKTPNRSHYINLLLRRRMIREQAEQERERAQKVIAA